MTQHKKVLFIGNGFSGKSTVVRRLLGTTGTTPEDVVLNSLSTNHTLGVEVHPYISSLGKYNIWDCAGIKAYGGLVEGNYIQADLAIVFDGGSTNVDGSGVKHPHEWVAELTQLRPGIPVYIACGSLEEKYVRVKEILG